MASSVKKMTTKILIPTFFIIGLLTACVTETRYAYQKTTTGEAVDFVEVNEARTDCLKNMEMPQQTEDKPLIATTPEGTAVAVAASVAKEVTSNARQQQRITKKIDECLLGKGIKKVILN